MNPYIEKLEQQIGDNPPNFGMQILSRDFYMNASTKTIPTIMSR